KRLENPVPVIVRRRTVQYISPGIGHLLYYVGSRTPDLGGKTVGGNLKFLHSILRNIDEHAAHDIVVVVHAVDAYVAAASQLPGRRNDDSARLGGIEIGRNRITRNEQRQFQEIAAIQWQIVDLLCVYHAIHHRGHSIDEWD